MPRVEEWRLEPKTVEHWHRKYHDMTDSPWAIDGFFCLQGNWMVSLACSLLITRFIVVKAGWLGFGWRFPTIRML